MSGRTAPPRTPRQGDVFMVRLDPVVGHEMGKTRPCVIVSPDEANRRVRTVIVAPLTGVRRGYPSRVDSTFDGSLGQVALDQMRACDGTRLGKWRGRLAAGEFDAVLAKLRELFKAPPRTPAAGRRP